MTDTGCESCGQTRELVSREARIQRGERRVTYTAQFWSCPGCRDPESGETPFVFADNELLDRNYAAAQAAWQQRYGEPLPVRRAPGRPREQPQRRDETIALRLTAGELEPLDAERGEQSRSAYIRAKLFGLALFGAS